MFADTKKPIGSGNFGTVYYGQIHSPDSQAVSVAVKSINYKAGDECIKALLTEITIMAYVGKHPHPHILKFVGCCTRNILQGKSKE